MSQRILTDEQAGRYHEEGSVLARGFFDAEETDLLRRAVKEDHELDRRAFGRADGEGGAERKGSAGSVTFSPQGRKILRGCGPPPKPSLSVRSRHASPRP